MISPLRRLSQPPHPLSLLRLDGVFEPSREGRTQFRQAPALTQRDRDAVTEQVCRRVLRWLARSGLLDPDDARGMFE